MWHAKDFFLVTRIWRHFNCAATVSKRQLMVDNGGSFLGPKHSPPPLTLNPQPSTLNPAEQTADHAMAELGPSTEDRAPWSFGVRQSNRAVQTRAPCRPATGQKGQQSNITKEGSKKKYN